MSGLNTDLIASIAIHNLDDEVKMWLRERTADNGRTMGEEAQLILHYSIERKPPPLD